MNLRSFLKTLLLGAFFCSAQAISAAETIHSITFGSAGGFTGGGATYKLNSDGTLTGETFALPTKKKPLPTRNIEKSQVDEIFKEAAELNTHTYHKPSNMTRTLHIAFEGHTQRNVWGVGDTKIDARVNRLFSKLMELTRDAK